MGLFDLFKKKPKNTYSKGLISSKDEEGNIIVISNYLPDMTCISEGVGHYEFCVLGNHMFKYSKRLNFTTIRVYKNFEAAANAMNAEVKSLQSVGYKIELNDRANSHNLRLMKGELASKEENKPKLEKVTGDVCADAGYKPFATVQFFSGTDSQYIYLIGNTFVIYGIGEYNTSNIHTYETIELAGQGLTDYLTHTKSLGFTNLVHLENGIHNTLIESGIDV